MKIDCHLHTLPFSQDAGQTIDELITALNEKNLRGILTEHMDYDFPLDPTIVTFDPQEYFARYEPYRNDRLLLGVEAGLMESCRDRNNALAKDYPWDFFLVSIHTLYGKDLCNREFCLDRDQKIVYRDYLLDLIKETEALDDFDSLAHIDYICRYNHYEDSNFYYRDYPDYWDQLFRILAEKEKALEINTRRFLTPNAPESLFELLQRFRELGGKYLTIGSDAHLPRTVGHHIDAAYAMAEKANLRPVFFKKRQLNYL